MKLPYRALVAALLLSSLAGTSSAPAQSTQYDANCKAVTDEDKLAEREIAASHPIIGMGMKLGDKACAGHNFLVRLFKREPDPDKVDADDILEASKPAVATSLPDGMTSKQWKEKQERLRWEASHPNWKAEEHAAKMRNTNAANDASNFPEDQPSYTIIPPTNPNGFLTIFQAKTPAIEPPQPAALAAAPPPTLKDVQGEGTLLSATGIARGMFRGGKLEGQGEEVLPNGVWRGGEYQGGKLNGQGFELREENGQAVLTEGKFANNLPDGTVSRTYVNGAMQRELWGNGARMAQGTIAPAGVIPPDPVYKSPEQLAQEADAEFEHKLASTPSAAVLYAMADELAEKGDTAKAKRAYRTLMTRFPGSPLVDQAASQLAALGNSSPSGQPAKSGNAATPTATASGSYRNQIANPVLPQSFYGWLSGKNLPIGQCNDIGNGPRMAALSAELTPISQQGTFGSLRAVIISTEAGIAMMRQCEQTSEAQQQITQFQNIRASAITNCQQLSSSPQQCLAPFPWNH